jgi:aminopeptidase S
VLRDTRFQVSTPTYEVSADEDEGCARDQPQRHRADPSRRLRPRRDDRRPPRLGPEGPGIVDNGSGVASVLEIAKLGADPTVQNMVRFTFLDHNERGALGSTGYV